MPTEGPPSPVIAVVGPTATGKSELAIRIAETLGGEVVNADAMQLYAGMDIGTAKLSVSQRRGIPHHQLDVLDVTQEASVAAYQKAARADLDAIAERGRVPVLVGGSGLYVRAALDVLEIPPTDPAVRSRLETEATERGTKAMYAVLQAADPAAAAAIEPGNTRRIVRALEVIELTGRPFSATLPRREFVRPTVMVGLRCDRGLLDARIADRVDQMWAGGMLDEVRELEARGLRAGRTAATAIGYAQALAEIDGHLSGAQAREQTAAATRRLVRRQESWFRPDPRITWFAMDDPEAGWRDAVDFVTTTA
ncbi:MAG: tRNA (adenosine(37)-N6)-dimethylallyltransferase MiaA [Dermatophilaceae bacterium]